MLLFCRIPYYFHLIYHLSGKEKESVSMHMILKYCFYLIDHFQINIHI